MNTIEQQLRQFIDDNFLFGQGGLLASEESFLEKGILDSTGVLELVGFLEQQFGIRIEDDELVPENLDSIANLLRFVQAKRTGVKQTAEPV